MKLLTNPIVIVGTLFMLALTSLGGSDSQLPGDLLAEPMFKRELAIIINMENEPKEESKRILTLEEEEIEHILVDLLRLTSKYEVLSGTPFYDDAIGIIIDITNDINLKSLLTFNTNEHRQKLKNELISNQIEYRVKDFLTTIQPLLDQSDDRYLIYQDNILKNKNLDFEMITHAAVVDFFPHGKNKDFLNTYFSFLERNHYISRTALLGITNNYLKYRGFDSEMVGILLAIENGESSYSIESINKMMNYFRNKDYSEALMGWEIPISGVYTQPGDKWLIRSIVVKISKLREITGDEGDWNILAYDLQKGYGI